MNADLLFPSQALPLNDCESFQLFNVHPVSNFQNLLFILDFPELNQTAFTSQLLDDRGPMGFFSNPSWLWRCKIQIQNKSLKVGIGKYKIPEFWDWCISGGAVWVYLANAAGWGGGRQIRKSNSQIPLQLNNRFSSIQPNHWIVCQCIFVWKLLL